MLKQRILSLLLIVGILAVLMAAMSCPGIVSAESAGLHCIAGGEDHTVALKNDGTVWTWGYNALGQLGDGTTANKSTPVQVSGLTGVTSIAKGSFHTIALKNDGSVWTWGRNDYGQLGDSTTTNRYTPVQVSGLTGITDIAGGYCHTIALKSDGTVWAWGYNNYGQLGDSTTTNKFTPVQVPGLTGVTAITGGYYHTIALKNDGSVWTWGCNARGQLGDNTVTNRYTPVQVSGLTGVTAIAGGNSHTAALKSDGTVWTWGYNSCGQLGDGTTTYRLTPVQVSGLTGITDIASGSDHTIALKNDGTVWTWGRNDYGQLGDGTTTYRLTPVQVSGLTGVISIAGGLSHTIALKSDGTIWAWGYNNCGQLGNGTTTNIYAPVQVSGLATPPLSPSVIVPHLIADMQKYIQGDTVQLSLNLTNTQPGGRTNSVTFEVEYDGDTFEPATGVADTSVVNGYIPSDIKMNLGTGASKRILVSYVNMDTNVALQEGAKVFTANFKVKSNPQPGNKTFTLRPVSMIDSSGKVYNINDDTPVTKTVTVTDNAVIEGYLNIYLGDNGTGLNSLALGSLSQEGINETFRNLKFTLKHNPADTGTVFNGSDVFLPDGSGNLATLDGSGKVKGRFRVFTPDTASTLLSIDGVGYLRKDVTFPALGLGSISPVNTSSTPVEIYPGDLGHTAAHQLVLSPDGSITNADFSAWLLIYKSSQTGAASAEDKLKADFTKDGSIDNVDFSLWVASFRKVLTLLQ